MNSKKSIDSFYTKRGKILEVEALQLYEQIHDCKIERPGVVVNRFFLGALCSPDGIDGAHLLEVKAFKTKNHQAIKTLKDVPFKIMAQIQFNLLICNLGVAYLIMYDPSLKDPNESYREIEVFRSPKIQANLKRKLEEK